MLVLLLLVPPTVSGLFWNLLPRIDFGPSYYPPPAASMMEPMPIFTQPLRHVEQQPVQQIQYVYKQPIVKYIQPVRYVYLPSQQIVRTPAASNGGYQTQSIYRQENRDYNSQPPRAVYRLFPSEMGHRSYNPAHKLPSVLGKKANGKGNKSEMKNKPSTKQEEDDELVEWEDAQGKEDRKKEKEQAVPKEDINQREKTFHIHEDIEGAGKMPDSPKSKTSSILPNGDDDDLGDLDVLTTDDHMKSSEENLGPGGKPDTEKPAEGEMIAMENKKTTNEPTEMVAIAPKTQDQFIPIGSDEKKSGLWKMKPATAPPNLKKLNMTIEN